MAKFEAGLQIQLVTYLDAVCKQDNFNPAGLLYSGLIDSKVKLDNRRDVIDENEIKNEIRKNFKMSGFVLADVNVVKMMDKNLNTSNSSDIIPVGIKKDGGFTKSSKILNEEDFNNMQQKVQNIIKEISEEILDGNIDIKPYNYGKEVGCTYCKYMSICRFNPNQKDNSYNYIR